MGGMQGLTVFNGSTCVCLLGLLARCFSFKMRMDIVFESYEGHARWLIAIQKDNQWSNWHGPIDMVQTVLCRFTSGPTCFLQGSELRAERTSRHKYGHGGTCVVVFVHGSSSPVLASMLTSASACFLQGSARWPNPETQVRPMGLFSHRPTVDVTVVSMKTQWP